MFPFAYQVLTDHLSGRTGGRSGRCTASNTCPKAFDGNSSNEYRVKAGSLLHTDTRGNDLPDPENVRFFLISGLSHGVGNVNSMAMCQQSLNPTSPFPALRALLVALDQWVAKGTPPPESRVPRQSDKTRCNGSSARPADGARAPGGTGLADDPWRQLYRAHHDPVSPRFRADARQRHRVELPPSPAGRAAYPVFVSKVDQDGNEVAGIRMPPVEAPVATTTGWALRGDGFGENDGCEANGQQVPFKATKPERMAAGDPRLSLEERYKDHEGYVAAVAMAARKLHQQRLLLPADVQLYEERARASNVLR